MADFLPDVIGTLDMRTPLSEGFSFFIWNKFALVIVDVVSLLIDFECEHTPLAISAKFGAVIDDRLDHGNGCGVECGFCTANFADDLIDLGDGGDGGIERSQ